MPVSPPPPFCAEKAPPLLFGLVFGCVSSILPVSTALPNPFHEGVTPFLVFGAVRLNSRAWVWAPHRDTACL